MHMLSENKRTFPYYILAPYKTPVPVPIVLPKIFTGIYPFFLNTDLGGFSLLVPQLQELSKSLFLQEVDHVLYSGLKMKQTHYF